MDRKCKHFFCHVFIWELIFSITFFKLFIFTSTEHDKQIFFVIYFFMGICAFFWYHRKKVFFWLMAHGVLPPPLPFLAAGPAYYVLHPKNGIPICVFFNLPGLQKPGRKRFPKKSRWVWDLVVFDSQNKLDKNSLIGVQGDCQYILFFSVSYFNVMVICFNIW